MEDEFMMESTQKFENTYITEPEGYGEGQKFSRGVVKNVIQKIINDKLTGMAYDNTKASQVGKELSDMIKEKVKTMGFPRYKLIVQVRVQPLLAVEAPPAPSCYPTQFRCRSRRRRRGSPAVRQCRAARLACATVPAVPWGF
jgi:hypothetical protein